MKLTVPQLARATGSTFENAEKYVAELNEAMERYEINTPDRQAAFLAQVAIESNHLSAAEENLYYKDAERLAKIFKSKFKDPKEAEAFTRNPAGLSARVYDGLHGRGLLQTSGKKNYEAVGKALGQDFIANPQSLARPYWAAMSAAYYWDQVDGNKLADKWDMAALTKAINGPAMMHAEEREQLANENREWLGDVQVA